MPLGPVLAVLSVAALFIASAAAIVQKDLKRLLAYSSVAQIGYITLGISLGSAPGLTAAVAHLVNHGLTKGALFLPAGAIPLRAGGTGFGTEGDLTAMRASMDALAATPPADVTVEAGPGGGGPGGGPEAPGARARDGPGPATLTIRRRRRGAEGRTRGEPEP